MAASKQASKQTFKHTHAQAQCSNASVGLAQACPNQKHYRTMGCAAVYIASYYLYV